MEVFYRMNRWDKGAINKSKKGRIVGGWKRTGRWPFLSVRMCGGGWVWRRTHLADCLIGAGQKIPDWLIKIVSGRG